MRTPRDKRLPKLDTLQVKQQRAPRRQTWEEQLAIMQDWSARVNRAAAAKRK